MQAGGGGKMMGQKSVAVILINWHRAHGNKKYSNEYVDEKYY